MVIAAEHPVDSIEPLKAGHYPVGPLTWDEMWKFDDLPGGQKYELIDGELFVSPAPNSVHQRAVSRLFAMLLNAVRPGLEVFVGPFDWFVSQRTYFQPDLMVVRTAEVGEQRLETPPVLAIEVLSPSTRAYDLVVKRARFAQAGLEWYWAVDPKVPALKVFRLQGSELALQVEVVGDETYRTTDPIAFAITPADLIRPAGSPAT